MPESKHQEQLRGIALWCMSERRGILTPTGKPKKPPTYWIMRCPDCGLALMSSKDVTIKKVQADEATCKMRVSNQTVFTRSNWTSGNGERSKVCGNPVTMIEEVTT